MAVDVSKYASELNAVVRMDKAQIWNKIFQNSVSTSHCRTVSGIKVGQTHVDHFADVDEVVQGFQEGFTGKGTVRFEPSPTVQRGHKIDFDFNPYKFVNSWQGDLTVLGRDPKSWPLSRYVIYEILLPAILRDRENKQFYKGKYVAPVAGTPTTAAAAVDGIGQRLIEGAATGLSAGVNGISGIGPLAAGTVYDQLNTAAAQLPTEYRFSTPLKLYLSEDHLNDYYTGREEAIGTHVNTDDKNRNKLVNTMIELAGLPSMNGSNRFFITTPKNLVRTIDGPDPKALPMIVELAKRVISVYGDWAEAYGFGSKELVWANYIGAAQNGTDDETEVFA
ncbi:hypothetical protein V6R21_07680 [Limibacter armeniacum]|uniref:hypothetical protein n=1 Tax=Limibacter armeniacum TaxID=466084 RepID=UPI002FE59283